MTSDNIPTSEHLVIVQGEARSKGAKSAPKYEQKVHDAALEVFGEPLKGRNLSVEVHHFYTSGHSIDLDNLLKSVLDGLKGAAYEDDSQIAKVSAQRYNVSETSAFAVDDPRPEWLDLLPPRAAPADFVSMTLSRMA